MNTIYSLTELPPNPLFMFSVKDKSEAEKITTQYLSSWLYKEKLLFVLGAEYEERQKVKA